MQNFMKIEPYLYIQMNCLCFHSSLIVLSVRKLIIAAGCTPSSSQQWCFLIFLRYNETNIAAQQFCGTTHTFLHKNTKKYTPLFAWVWVLQKPHLTTKNMYEPLRTAQSGGFFSQYDAAFFCLFFFDSAARKFSPSKRVVEMKAAGNPFIRWSSRSLWLQRTHAYSDRRTFNFLLFFAWYTVWLQTPI